MSEKVIFPHYSKPYGTAEHEIKTEKCSDTCQYKIKVNVFWKNDPTLAEIYAITLNFGSDMQSVNCTGQHWKLSDVRLLFHALQ